MIYFFGGLLQITACVMEWVLGNTFSMVIFGTYGSFWFALATSLVPFYDSEGAFTNGKTGNALIQAEDSYYTSYGMYISYTFKV